ncbi:MULTISPECIES: YveK family protein [Oceanobacillus]|uniref:YveK family protein n=1 Tax=Oceanobacillus TaxID=182709 RepID=UPI0025A4BD30|nr:Wzz/FepE/Etk N-terminal domain-containing protein [Oceanobacillus oncorhynchi]MDM8101187.1 Wzz/FepE/Etk N-terminal domain-containing protein [Oceanobacillus oncorhynchi]
MEETISLKEIAEVIKKRLVLILAFILGMAFIAAIVSYFVITPQYESSSQFIVNQTQQEEDQFTQSDLRTNVEIINTYNVIISSPAILNPVIDELGLDLTTVQLADKINVSSEEDSQVVTVTATDEDPVQAVNIANTTVEIFQEEIPSIMNVDNVAILTQAELAENPSPVAPNPILNIAIGIVLGGMLGVGIAFILEYLDNTIRTEQDISKQLGVPVLGVISHVDESDIQGHQHPNLEQTETTGRRGLNGAKKTV